MYLLCRNEQYQEKLWRISCDLLKDWMSPEIWNKYSPSTKTTTTAAKQGSGNNDGADDQPTVTTDGNKLGDTVKDDDKPIEVGNDNPMEDSPEDKPVEDGDTPADNVDQPSESEQQ